MLPWQPFLAFYIWGAHWRHLKNTTEPSMCGGDAALCQITLTTCCYKSHRYKTANSMHCSLVIYRIYISQQPVVNVKARFYA